MFVPNGSKPKPETSERGLRWIWFGGSIISDWNNPIATTNRAVIRALQHHGHRIVHIEPGDALAFLDALRARGSAIYRAFQDAYPDIHYRRESIPGGSEGDVWLSRETALADVLIVQDDAPPQVFGWLQRVPASPIVRVLVARDNATGADHIGFDTKMSPDAADPAKRYGPAVLAASGAPAAGRSGELVVAYGGAEPGMAAGHMTEIVAAGAVARESLPFVPEARLESRYHTLERVTLYDDDPSPFAAARAMLAAAQGAAVSVVRADGAAQAAPEWHDANELAGRMIKQVTMVRARRQRIKE